MAYLILIIKKRTVTRLADGIKVDILKLSLNIIFLLKIMSFLEYVIIIVVMRSSYDKQN